MELSYAEMSYLRELVKKDKTERSRALYRIFQPKHHEDTAIVQKKLDEYWKFHRMDPPISPESCIMLLLERFEKLEDECQKALAMKD